MAGDDEDTVAADFRFLIERNADGIIVVDDGGTVLFANPAAEEAFGRPASELVGSAIGLPLAAGETAEISILRPGGSQIDAEMRIVATRWAGQAALLVSLRDISARKASEERLRQAHKMEAVGRLTAGVAHDFNNLLTVVIGNLETIQRETQADGFGARVKRAAANAMVGAKRAATLTQRLLAFSRRQPLEPKSVDVNKLILGMPDLLHRTLGASVTVETKLCDEVVCVEADPSQLETAILNLAVNARDAMPDGGRLTLETGSGRAGEDGPEGLVEIRVRDDGVGIPKEILAKVFEPFFTTKDVGQGTGLGLSQVLGFVKQSGGDVAIDSVLGEGTTVTIMLPRASSPAAAEPERAAVQPVAIPRESILAVDDEEDVRAYCVETLSGLGYRMFEADGAVSALDVLDRHPEIQLLFTDVGLPGRMNGRALANEARRRFPHLKVLLTSGYAGDTLVSGGRLEPGLQFLSKPYTFSALSSKIRAVLDGNSRPPPRILVVEDELFVRMTVMEALIAAGCEVDEAETASEAIVKFSEIGPALDAAIIDIGLPDGRGDGLIRKFRAERPDFTILLSTGYNDDVPEDVALDDRIELLNKPFDAAGLYGALRSIGLAIPS